MRIAINCHSFLKKNYAGIGRYAYNLVNTLSKIDQNNEYWLYVQKGYFDFKKHAPRVAARNFSLKIDWLGRGIGKVLHPIDIYHAPSPEFVNISDTRIVVTVHDLVYKTYPQGHTQQTIETTERQLKLIVERADRIICCSKNTMQDLVRHFSVSEDKLSLVYQGVDKNMFFPLGEKEREFARRVLKKRGIQEPFILFVGTIEPRKNLQNLLLAFSEIKRKQKFAGKLIVVGMKGWMLEGLDQVIQNFKLEHDIIFPGYVSDDELRYFYNLAEVFVFPSFYEGFGFPIIEAFSCGAAVVTSNISSCPEIAAEGALTVDPYDPQKIADAVIRIIEDKVLKEDLQKKALHRAGDFSFLKTAQQTRDVYQQVHP